MKKCFVVLVVAVLAVLMSFSVAWAAKPVQYVVHANNLQLSVYKEVVDEFTAATGIPVEIITTTGGQKGKWEKVLTLIAGGVSPDVVGGVSTEFGEFAIKGILLPLDELIKKDNVNMSRLIPPVVQALQFQGRQYLLPYGASVLTWVYNIHHFDRAGLAYPPKQWNTADWTYDNLVQTAKKLTVKNSEGAITQYGISGPFMDSWITLPYPWGGRWVTDDLRTFLGTSEEAIASVQAFQDLIHQHQVMPTGNAVGNFTSGKAAMAGVGTWNLLSLIDSNEDWDFMPWFRVKETAQAAINPIGYCILNTSTNLEGAWELVKWITWNKKANLDYSIAAGAIPALLDNLPEWRSHWQKTTGRPVTPDVAIQQAASHGAIIQIRKSPAFWTINDIMTAAVNDVIQNRKSARTAIMEVAGVIQELLEQTAP
ncbi:MAG TPA: sugar ABC transporter substrate-binding protein [Firmicutes bacterium]|nr:sugar ABC transporter substrate-binding protein [Bacillota bacterium]